MHVRIEREAAQIFIKEAAFQDDALHFRFESDTSMPNGDLIVRYGIAVCLPRADHLVSCVFTAPKGSWDTYLPIAEELLSSLRLPS